MFRDYPQVRATCLAAEQKYGLAVTAPADKTAATHTTRAEVEKAARGGQPMAARDWLRVEAQHAAAASRTPVEFLDRLRAVGVVVQERRDPAGGLTGYAVGRAEPAAGTGGPVLFGGGKLAPDLSLPRLQARWDRIGEPTAVGGGSAGGAPAAADEQVRRELWQRATRAAAEAAELVRAQALTDPDAAGDSAAAAAEVLAAAGRLIEGDVGGPLTQAGRDYDRAARERYGQAPAASDSGAALRWAAWQLARAGRRPGRDEAAQVRLLITQVARLSVAVSQLRQAQGRAVQATAAHRAAIGMKTASDHWHSQATAERAEQAQAHRQGATRGEEVGAVARAAAGAARPAEPPRSEPRLGRGR